MMRLPKFRFEMPGTLAEAAAIVAENPDRTRLVAGGTDLWPNLKRRHQEAGCVVSLAKVAGIAGIAGDGATGVTIGAMTTLAEICENDMLARDYPGFVRAVRSISAPVLRNMGTIGGNLCLDTRCTYYNQNEEWRRSIGYCMKAEGTVCWVAPGSSRCWATSATDSAPVLCAIGATIKLVSTEGERVIDLAALYQDDGIDYLTKRRDEILTELRLPAVGGAKSSYWKLRRRGSIDFPVLGVGAMLELDDQGVCTRAAVWLGAVRSAPVACADAAAHLVGKKIDENVVAEAAKLARKPAAPLDNTDFVVAWRKTMVERYVDGVLRELAGLPEKVKNPRHGIACV
ncbi:MAG: FAD binding domain-containing protein [Planctomycetes bacterium]|nr:FAD binding domain-containing protein [Planctomycetota bacterium]